MFQNLCEMARKGFLNPPKHEMVQLDNFQEAIARVSDLSLYHERKLIFSF